MLANILDPNKYVAPNYVQYVVLDAAGIGAYGPLAVGGTVAMAVVLVALRR